MAFTQGDTIITGAKSSAKLQIDNNKQVEVSANTKLVIKELLSSVKAKSGKTDLTLSGGKVKVKISKKLEGESKFDVQTPNAIMGVMGTEFYVYYDQNGETWVGVLEGVVTVQLENQATPVQITANQAIYIRTDGTMEILDVEPDQVLRFKDEGATVTNTPPPVVQPVITDGAAQETIDWALLEQERLEQEQLEQERLEQERLEQERLEQERLEQERLEQERLEQERLERCLQGEIEYCEETPPACEPNADTCEDTPPTCDPNVETCEELPPACDPEVETCEELPPTCEPNADTCPDVPLACDPNIDTCEDTPPTCDPEVEVCEELPPTCEPNADTCPDVPLACEEGMSAEDCEILLNNAEGTREEDETNDSTTP
ncbi:FecR domain-containing protein [Solibacillus sp.]|uniref:FecR domain-containing protein n=1 Tax=Solibacillus sp. TaxID=1909654 RepID=UPI0033157AA4